MSFGFPLNNNISKGGCQFSRKSPQNGGIADSSDPYSLIGRGMLFFTETI